MPKMGFNKEQMKGPEPVPGNQWYDVRLKGFKPKEAKGKDSTNLNAEFEIINHPVKEYNGRRVFDSLNTKIPNFIQDMVHSLGLEMEVNGDDSNIPGEFLPDTANPNDVSKWKYSGPLVGRTASVELIVSNYQGQDSNKIKQYRCVVPDCATKNPTVKHSTNHVKS